ncbi:hypothetical protein J6590_057556 [Homalodisca vitripennis]|nr:hypothetical protein J6590_057556 [Homalodisca vitripennis]
MSPVTEYKSVVKTSRRMKVFQLSRELDRTGGIHCEADFISKYSSLVVHAAVRHLASQIDYLPLSLLSPLEPVPPTYLCIRLFRYENNASFTTPS